MQDVRTDTEILELAIAREEDAYNFFTSMAEQVEDIQIRAVFEDLAREEIEHKSKLELEYIKTGRVLPKRKKTEPKLEVVFQNPDINMTYRNILQLAIDKEDASFKFYVSMTAQVHDQMSKDVLMALAEEEVKHKLRFQTAYNNLTY